MDLMQIVVKLTKLKFSSRTNFSCSILSNGLFYLMHKCFRQCFCCFRDPKNYEKFHLITQSIIVLVVKQLKSYRGEDVIHSSLDFDDKKLSKSSPNVVKIVEVTEDEGGTEDGKVKEERESKEKHKATPRNDQGN